MPLGERLDRLAGRAPFATFRHFDPLPDLEPLLTESFPVAAIASLPTAWPAVDAITVAIALVPPEFLEQLDLRTVWTAFSREPGVIFGQRDTLSHRTALGGRAFSMIVASDLSGTGLTPKTHAVRPAPVHAELLEALALSAFHTLLCVWQFVVVHDRTLDTKDRGSPVVSKETRRAPAQRGEAK
jgi:hypothetical protein